MTVLKHSLEQTPGQDVARQPQKKKARTPAPKRAAAAQVWQSFACENCGRGCDTSTAGIITTAPPTAAPPPSGTEARPSAGPLPRRASHSSGSPAEASSPLPEVTPATARPPAGSAHTDGLLPRDPHRHHDLPLQAAAQEEGAEAGRDHRTGHRPQEETAALCWRRRLSGTRRLYVMRQEEARRPNNARSGGHSRSFHSCCSR